MKILYLVLSIVSIAGSVEIIVDTSEAPSLEEFGVAVGSTLYAWFDQVEEILDSPTYVPPEIIHVFFDPTYEGVAYANGTQIVGSVSYYESHQDDLGSMVHELAHVIQAYPVCYTNDDWYITEGIADWVRFYHYEPENQPPKPGPSNNYTDGYRITAYFLNWVELRNSSLIYSINKECREGTYDSSHELFLRHTGKPIHELWDDMLASLRKYYYGDLFSGLVEANPDGYAGCLNSLMPM